MNTTNEKMNSGNIMDTDETSCQLKHFNLTDFNNLREILDDRKANLRNSAELKSQIHSKINELIETLKERERQLFLEIDEHDINCIFKRAEEKLRESSSEKLQGRDHLLCFKEKDPGHSSAIHHKKLKFLGNSEILKTELQEFGQIQEVVETSFENCENLDRNVSDPSPVKRRSSFNVLMSKLIKKNKTKALQRESSGSVESFEFIDGLGFDEIEYKKYMDALKDTEDGIEVVSNPDEYQAWQPSFPIHEIEYLNSPNQNSHQGLISTVQSTSKETNVKSESEPAASNYQDISESPVPKEISDPVTQFRKQLQGFQYSPSCDKKCPSKAETCQLIKSSNQSFLLKENKKSHRPSSTPVPSAIIQETFNKYLIQGSPEKWLAPSVNRPHCELISYFKGLHCRRID